MDSFLPTPRHVRQKDIRTIGSRIQRRVVAYATFGSLALSLMSFLPAVLALPLAWISLSMIVIGMRIQSNYDYDRRERIAADFPRAFRITHCSAFDQSLRFWPLSSLIVVFAVFVSFGTLFY